MCRDAIISVCYPLDDPPQWVAEPAPTFTPTATKPAPMPMQLLPLNHCQPYMHAPAMYEGCASRTPSPPSTPPLTSTPPTPSLQEPMVLFDEAQETLRVERAPCADSYACEELYLCISEATETESEWNHASKGLIRRFDEGTDEGFAEGPAEGFDEGPAEVFANGVVAAGVGGVVAPG
eukprot:3694263-Pleurochrysis_carterae.AAC.1